MAAVKSDRATKKQGHAGRRVEAVQAIQ